MKQSSSNQLDRAIRREAERQQDAARKARIRAFARLSHDEKMLIVTASMQDTETF
jgi:hypothetical protein